MLRALLLLALAACVPDALAGHRYDRSPSSTNVQAFDDGAGTYTWRKPAGASLCLVALIAAGGAGGSGGYDTSDSGGGGGGGGQLGLQMFHASQLNGTEDVVLAAGAGGAAVTVAGNGNGDVDVGETSFGAAARNLVRIDHRDTCSGAGGDSSTGSPGTSCTVSSADTAIGSFFSVITTSGTAGNDTLAATAASDLGHYTITGATPLTGWAINAATGGGGGGGTNGGANFTAGGNGGGQLNRLSGYVVRADALGGTTDGADGEDGADGGIGLVNANGAFFIYGGQGGGGGAGSVVADTNGGDGGDGGNCGGGGGGGGATATGTGNESGAGGNGGAGCVFVMCW